MERNGYQVLILPMKNFQISQGNNGQYSHQGVNALDLCGADYTAEYVVAPCDMHYVAHDSYANGNAVWFESDRPVIFADGTVNYATIMMIHCNDISWVLGRSFKQGEVCYSEGIAGYATGNHVHFEIAKGKFSHCYDRNGLGVYHLPNSISADLACITDGTNLINGGQPVGSGNRMYWKKADEIPGVINSTGFCDVPENAYFSNSIKEAKQLGLITGSDGAFRPFDPITRGDLCTILHRLKGSPKVNQINPFVDVASTDYFYMAVMWATLQGITAGTGQRFRPKDTATRAEAITFLYRLCGSPKQEDTELTFTDVPEDIYYRKPVEWGVRNNIINGKSQDKFDPYAECSRADFVVMLMRTYHRKK